MTTNAKMANKKASQPWTALANKKKTKKAIS
jgi:hypothetical protein